MPLFIIWIIVTVAVGIAILAGTLAERKLRKKMKDDPTKFKEPK